MSTKMQTISGLHLSRASLKDEHCAQGASSFARSDAVNKRSNCIVKIARLVVV